MHTNRGPGIELSRMNYRSPVLPQSKPHLLPRLPDVLGMGHMRIPSVHVTIYT
mgnify:FL=1